MSNTSITDSIASILQALASERDTLANALAAAEEQIADLRARAERADKELARAEERRQVPLDAERLAAIFAEHYYGAGSSDQAAIAMRSALLALREAMGSKAAWNAFEAFECRITNPQGAILAAFDAACSVAVFVDDKSREANEIHRLETVEEKLRAEVERLTLACEHLRHERETLLDERNAARAKAARVPNLEAELAHASAEKLRNHADAERWRAKLKPVPAPDGAVDDLDRWEKAVAKLSRVVRSGGALDTLDEVIEDALRFRALPQLDDATVEAYAQIAREAHTEYQWRDVVRAVLSTFMARATSEEAMDDVTAPAIVRAALAYACTDLPVVEREVKPLRHAADSADARVTLCGLPREPAFLSVPVTDGVECITCLQAAAKMYADASMRNLKEVLKRSEELERLRAAKEAVEPTEPLRFPGFKDAPADAELAEVEPFKLPHVSLAHYSNANFLAIEAEINRMRGDIARLGGGQ